jgi:hypothetical protein
VGKHTSAKIIAEKLGAEIVDINKVAIDNKAIKKKTERGLDVDVRKLSGLLAKLLLKSESDLVIVGHLAPYVLKPAGADAAAARGRSGARVSARAATATPARKSPAHRAPVDAPAFPPAPARRAPVAAIVFALLPALLAGALFVQRAGRPLEQGGDAYSDANAILAGENFVTRGFARLHFLPVIVPDPADPPAKEDFYTHYPPGADLANGVLRALGIGRLEGWRLVAAAFSLAGLAFWFLALRRLFGDAVAAAGVAAYALNFSFVWLGDSIHHYAYSDFLRSAAFWLGVRIVEDGARARDTALLCAVLFLQSLLAFDYLPWTHILLLGLGATGFRGPKLRRMLLFAAMPVLGVGLHMLQNVWALGVSAAWADMGGALAQRALASGSGSFERFSFASVISHVIRDTHQLMGVGLGTILGFGALGAAAWLASAPEGERTRAARVLGVLALATSFWFVAMHQHAAEHPYSNRQLLPLAALAFALGLAGIGRLAARVSRPLAVGLVAAAAIGLVADGWLGYANDGNRRALATRSFQVAYARRGDVPAGVTVASNIPAPAPPALQVVLDRRVKKVRNLAELEAAYGRGATVVYLYSPAAPIDGPLMELLRQGRLIAADEAGPLVEIEVPREEPAGP